MSWLNKNEMKFLVIKHGLLKANISNEETERIVNSLREMAATCDKLEKEIKILKKTIKEMEGVELDAHTSASSENNNENQN